MDKIIWLAPLFAAVALLFALYKARYVSKCEPGNSRMQEIAAAIAEGASAFLRAEYKILAIFIVVLFVLIAIFINIGTAVCFVIGACFSILAGFFGMRVATKANVRTANAALGGLLAGSLVTGVLLAIYMSNAGGAWDNAKKYIEGGNLAGHGKKSPAHKAAVTGDTVGDTRKDVVGVALDIFIKTMSTVANTLVSVFSRFTLLK